MTVTGIVGGLSRALAGSAARELPAGTLAGIGLACGACSAAWFSAGTRPAAIAGALLLGGCHLAMRGAARTGAAGSGAAAAALAESAVYAGLAAGAAPGRGPGIWALAAAVTGLRAVCDTAAACRGRPGRAPATAGRPVLAAARAPVLPPGARAALAMAVTPVWGGRAALAALLGWGVIETAAVLLPRPGRGRDRRVPAGSGARVPLTALLAHSAAAGATGLAPGATGPGPAATGRAAGGARPGPCATGPRPGAFTAPPGTARAAAGAVPAANPLRPGACRDDGRFARWTGRVLRGQLAPLPPALVGAGATAALAAAGLRDCRGILALAPVAALMLAAPGSGHPHDGPLDWLVPALLHAGEYLYAGALGFAAGVPGPLVFTLVGMTAALHRAAALAVGPAGARRLRAAGGWEGRILAAGLAATLGLATLAYAALTAYLGLVLGRAILSGPVPAARGGAREAAATGPTARATSTEGDHW